MKIMNRVTTSLALAATVAVGLSLQACGGSGPEGEPVEKSAQDLSIFGVPVPAPTVSVSVGDHTATVNPVGAIDTLIPQGGIKIPDPLTPVNKVIGALDNGVSVGLTAPCLEVGIALPGLDILPQLPNPWADAGGITVIGK